MSKLVAALTLAVLIALAVLYASTASAAPSKPGFSTNPIREYKTMPGPTSYR